MQTKQNKTKTQWKVLESVKEGNGHCTESAAAIIGSVISLHDLARFVRAGEVQD